MRVEIIIPEDTKVNLIQDSDSRVRLEIRENLANFSKKMENLEDIDEISVKSVENLIFLIGEKLGNLGDEGGKREISEIWGKIKFAFQPRK